MRTMILAEEAWEIIRQVVRPLPDTVMPVKEAGGRVLSEDVTADADVPGFDNASMDGFALVADPESHRPDRRYRIIGEAAAGRPFAGQVRPGEAVRIMTGAPVPHGAGAIVEVEQVDEADGSIRFDRPPEPGRHIRRAGEDLTQGSTVLTRGTRLRSAHLGILTSLGRSTAKVIRQPQASVVTTGSELIEPGRSLSEGQIFNSSAVVVPEMLREAHAAVASTHHVSDDPNAMRRVFEKALTNDLLVTTGGVSAGKHDLVLDVLRSVGVTFHFWKVRIKPGMPIAFGATTDGRPVLCLPGNPVSTGVTFLQFVRPLLDALEGVRDDARGGWMAQLEHEIVKKDSKRHFGRGIASIRDGVWKVRLTGPQSSGMFSSMVQANCLIVIPEEVDRLRAGDSVEVQWL